jgi:hypothetical protein
LIDDIDKKGSRIPGVNGLSNLVNRLKTEGKNKKIRIISELVEIIPVKSIEIYLHNVIIRP